MRNRGGAHVSKKENDKSPRKKEKNSKKRERKGAKT